MKEASPLARPLALHSYYIPAAESTAAFVHLLEFLERVLQRREIPVEFVNVQEVNEPGHIRVYFDIAILGEEGEDSNGSREGKDKAVLGRSGWQ